jgi:hypothetical protein
VLHDSVIRVSLDAAATGSKRFSWSVVAAELSIALIVVTNAWIVLVRVSSILRSSPDDCGWLFSNKWPTDPRNRTQKMIESQGFSQ